MSKIICKYRSENGRQLTIEGDSDDQKFMDECMRLTGRESRNFGGVNYYPYYTYHVNPIYTWAGYSYPYYYYPYYPYYANGFYGGYRRSCWGGC